MPFVDLKLHGHSDIFFLQVGVNQSDPGTSSTTNHKFYRALGRLHHCVNNPLDRFPLQPTKESGGHPFCACVVALLSCDDPMFHTMCPMFFCIVLCILPSHGHGCLLTLVLKILHGHHHRSC
jgi:hypothetical protein